MIFTYKYDLHLHCDEELREEESEELQPWPDTAHVRRVGDLSGGCFGICNLQREFWWFGICGVVCFGIYNF